MSRAWCPPHSVPGTRGGPGFTPGPERGGLGGRPEPPCNSMHDPGHFARGAADGDPPRHAHALDVGGPAGMDGDDAVALLQLEESVWRAPRLVARERGGPDGFEDRAGHPEPGHLAVVRELRPFVRARALRVRLPEVAQPEEPHDFRLDVDVRHEIAAVRVLREGHAVALRRLAVAQEPVPHAVA